ncbi:MAG: phage-related minor tail protein [Hyphomicrobiaceae bacterium]|jgi:phage-related minor tail protein
MGDWQMDETSFDDNEFDRFDTRGMTRELEQMNRLGDQFARTMSRAFVDVSLRGKSFGDVLRGLGQQLATLALKSAMKPLENAVGSLFGNLLGGQLGGQFAKGSAFQKGSAIPFAQGGVIAQPTYFPMAGGRAGLMGERGAEAIMPLARGPDGRLGVRSSGGGGGQNITVNVSTPDVEGFRRSQSQIAAMLSRTVSQGQRNL